MYFVVRCASCFVCMYWLHVFYRSISVGCESPCQLGEGLGRTGGWGACALKCSAVCLFRWISCCWCVFWRWLWRYSNQVCNNKYSYSTYDWTFLCHHRDHYNTVIWLNAWKHGADADLYLPLLYTVRSDSFNLLTLNRIENKCPCKSGYWVAPKICYSVIRGEREKIGHHKPSKYTSDNKLLYMSSQLHAYIANFLIMIYNS